MCLNSERVGNRTEGEGGESLSFSRSANAVDTLALPLFFPYSVFSQKSELRPLSSHSTNVSSIFKTDPKFKAKWFKMHIVQHNI